MKKRLIGIVKLAVVVGVVLASPAIAQPNKMKQHSNPPRDEAPSDLPGQAERLHQKGRHLNHQMQSGADSGSMPGMGMGGMGRGMMGRMPMNSGMSGESGAMHRKGMMEGMKSGNSMSGQSPLPGFPGAPHLYHVGANDFFLDSGEAIELSAEQRSKLTELKERAALGFGGYERKIEALEEQVWELTSADRPDGSAIEGKIKQIESARGSQRLAFIRAVGEAANVLTHGQRLALTSKH